MPTPFMHLEIAERIIQSPQLPSAIGQKLTKNFPAFYLGCVAPDVQSVADIRREETHFYVLPPESGDLAYPTMLKNYPQIASGRTLPSDQATFVAGYCAHLLLDLRWYHDILMPFFVERPIWRSLRQAFLVHNTLLTYLDKTAVSALPETAGETLAAAEPKNWLPFVSDTDLLNWRDQLVEQLYPGAMLMTVEVYARRLGISAAEFEENLEHEEWMEKHLFKRVPIDEVSEIIGSAASQSIDVISQYLSN